MSIRPFNPSILVFLFLLLPACGSNSSRLDLSSRTKEAWNALNDPLNLKNDYEVNLSLLPLNADTSKKPWSDTYWPNYEGGLAFRWNDPEQPDSFNYPLQTASVVSSLDKAALSRLSPAEKYDIFMGRYDYPLVKEERARTKPDDPGWFGLCHGWAPAAINFAEPNPVTLAGAQGIQVPFGSSDIKALLLFAQQYGEDSRMAGDRCNDNDNTGPACSDINAGSFHIILANQIGLDDESFVADISQGEQVWNQPIYGFNSEILGESSEVATGAAAGTVKTVLVRTNMKYMTESSPSWEPKPFDLFPNLGATLTYEYKLEVNAAGEIIGGEWTDSDHPDFFWTQSPFAWTGYFKRLKGIYDAATDR